jgi:hypothetical protein
MLGHLVAVFGLLAEEVPDADLRAAPGLLAKLDAAPRDVAGLLKAPYGDRKRDLLQRRAQPALLEEEGRELQDSLQGKGNAQTVTIDLKWHHYKCASKEDCYNGGGETNVNAHSYPNCNCGDVNAQKGDPFNRECENTNIDGAMAAIDGSSPGMSGGTSRFNKPTEENYGMVCASGTGYGSETNWPCQHEACRCHWIASVDQSVTNDGGGYPVCGYWKAHGALPKVYRNTFSNLPDFVGGDDAFGGPPAIPGDPERRTFADLTTDLLYALADAMDKTDHDFKDAASVLVSDVYQNFHATRPDLSTMANAVKLSIDNNEGYNSAMDPTAVEWRTVSMNRMDAGKGKAAQMAEKTDYGGKKGIHDQWEQYMLPAPIMTNEATGAEEGTWMCKEKDCWDFSGNACQVRSNCPNCPEECLGVAFKLQNILYDLKRDKAAALVKLKDALSTVRPNITNWTDENSFLTKELLGKREDLAKMVKNFTNIKGVDMPSGFNNPINWSQTAKLKFNPELKDVLDESVSKDEAIKDEKEAWADAMNELQKQRLLEQSDETNLTAEDFHIWYLTTKQNMSDYEKQDSSALRDFEEKEGDLKRLDRESRKNMSKESILMSDLDRQMGVSFKKEQRKNDKLAADLHKRAEKAIEETQQNDLEDVKDFTRQSDYQVGARTKQFDKLMKAVDKTRSRELAAMYNKLEELSSGAMRVDSRAGQSAHSTALESIAETITKANSAMAMTMSDTAKAENSADSLTKKKAENMKSNTVFRIDQITQYITDAVQNMTETIGDIVTGTMIPDEQKNQRLRKDEFDGDYKKYEREDKLLDRRVEAAMGRYQTMLTELKALIGTAVGGEPNAQLEGVYAYLDTLVGIDPAGDRNKVDASVKHTLREVSNQLEDLMALANSSKASLAEQGRDAKADFTQQMTDTRTEATTDVSTMNNLLGQKMDVIKAQFATHTTGEGGLDDQIGGAQTRLKTAMEDIPVVVNDVAKSAEQERMDARAEETKTDDAVAQLGLDQVATAGKKKQTFDQDLLGAEHAILDGVSSRKAAFEEDTIQKAEAKIQKVYTEDYLPGRRERLAEVQAAALKADDENRKLTAFEDDFGPTITKLDLKATRVGEATKNQEEGYRHAAKLGYESAMKRLTSAQKPIIDAKYGDGKSETQKAAAEIAELQDAFEAHVATETKKMQQGAGQAVHSTQPLAGALKQATTEFDAQVLGQTSMADGLSSLVSGSIDRLSTADLAARHASGNMDDALAAHKKAMLKKVDKLGGSLSLKEKAALEKQVAEMAEQMAAVGAEENGELSEEAKKKLADLSKQMEDTIGEKKTELQKAEFWQHNLQEETVKGTKESAEEESSLAGNVLAQTSKEETELNQQAKEEMHELGEEAGPAEQILYTLQQVQQSLNTLRDSSDSHWREMKRDHQAHADDAFQTALNQFAAIHAKHAEALETAKEAGRRLDQTVLEVESDMTDDRRRLNSTSIQVSNRLDTEVGNLDADVKAVNSATDTGARLVAELANKTAGGIGEVATDADQRMEKREASLENAENLQVSAEESDIMALAGDAQAASARSTSLDHWFHRFGSMDLAFKTAVADKLKDLGAEGADLDAQALRQASSARLGIVDMKSEMGKEAGAPLADA